MTDETQQAGADAPRATRYKVGVGEDFPLLEQDRHGRVDFSAEWQCGYGRDRRSAHRDERWEEFGGYRLPRLFYVLAAVAVFVALISAAVSYPLATLGVVAALLLLAGGPRRRRRSFDYRDWDGPRRGERDAA